LPRPRAGRRERRDRAGLESGGCDDLVRPGDPRVAGAHHRSDLCRVRAPVAGNEREHRAAVADEDDRLDDLRCLAPDCACGRARGRRAARELLQPHIGAALADDRRDALDGLRPGAHAPERTAATETESRPLSGRETTKGDEMDDKVKRAHTEALFRDVNERIAESAQRFEADSTQFVCECADPGCVDRVEATLDEYEEVRSDGATFMLTPGHLDEDIERVVSDRGRFHVVEKVQRTVRATVKRLDPRTA
jgi:hypothetical protein